MLARDAIRVKCLSAPGEWIKYVEVYGVVVNLMFDDVWGIQAVDRVAVSRGYKTFEGACAGIHYVVPECVKASLMVRMYEGVLNEPMKAATKAKE